MKKIGLKINNYYEGGVAKQGSLNRTAASHHGFKPIDLDLSCNHLGRGQTHPV